MHPVKAWINQPSIHQPENEFHGKNVFVIGKPNGPHKYEVPGHYEGSEYIHAYFPDTLECILVHHQSLEIGGWKA